MILSALLALVLFPAAANAVTTATITVTNENGAALTGVSVAAISWGQNGPDGAASTFTVTGGSGQAVLALQDDKSYEIFVTSHGYAPTLRDVFNSPDPELHTHFYTDGQALAKTVVLSSADVSDVGQIRLAFANATADTILFGGVHDNRIGEQAAAGIAVADGVGGGTLTVFNVPFAPANTYGIGMYDPQKNQGVGRGVNLILDAGNPVVTFNGIDTADFDNAIPPQRVESTAGQQSSGGSAAVEGAVVDTTTAHTPIPHMGVSFQGVHGGAWTQSDDNGHFQLFNLVAGDTYYAQIYGGCTWSPSGPGDCYEPWSSPACSGQSGPGCQFGTAPAENDFVYNSTTTTVFKRIMLNKVAGGTGQMAVYVKTASGLPLPNAHVGLNPDGSAWHTGAAPNCGSSFWMPNPGFSNAQAEATTGYALLTGLPSGNYMVNVWTPFSSGNPQPVNAGANGEFSWDWQAAHCGQDSDDLRISIDTAAAPNYLQVFDASGTSLNLSSITVVVNTDTNQSGEVKGTLTFSSVADLRDAPVTITLYPQQSGPCGGPDQSPCLRGNFAVVDSSGSSSYGYVVKVGSGTSYWMDIRAKGWGIVRTHGGDDRVNLETSSSVVRNVEFAPAGAVTGTVYKPDGTIYQPSNTNGPRIHVNANGEGSWGHTELGKDGTFTIEGLLPGVFHLEIFDPQFPYALPTPRPSATVTAGVTSTANIYLLNGTYLGIGFDRSKTFDPRVIVSTEPGEPQVLLGFDLKVLPAGTVLSNSQLIEMMIGEGNYERDMHFVPQTSTSAYSQCGQGWPGGFCAKRVPSPSQVDLMVVKKFEFGKEGAGPGDYLSVVVVASTRGIVVDDVHATSAVKTGSSVDPQSGNVVVSTAAGVAVNMTPNPSEAGRGNAYLQGSFTGVNWFRKVDFDALGGDFERFLQYLPTVALYDQNGVFRAMGIVTPSPQYIQAHDADFESSFAQGYPQFMALANGDPAGLRYLLQDLAPNACYTEVVTTPNYPSYQTKVCLGVAGSTTTVNVNLDTAVGAGATVQGVVTSTSSVPIDKAKVELSGEGVGKKTIVTAADGAYVFPGLPAGTVKIKASASGYAPAWASLDVSGSQVYTRDIQLSSAPGTISGTVYSQKLPFTKVQPGALIYGYDETYNHDNPGAPLPLYKTQTGDDGAYTLTGMIPGHTYKVFLKVPGKYVLSESTVAVNGAITGIDFTMRTKPLDIEVFCRPGSVNYECEVQNPSDFKSGTATYSAAPWVDAASSIGVNFTELPNKKILGLIPLSSLSPGTLYQMRAVAVSNSNKTVTKDIFFGLGIKGSAKRQIDSMLIGDEEDDGTGRRLNEAAFDPSGQDLSSLSLPAGAAQATSSAAVPTCSFSGASVDDSTVAAKVAVLPPNSIVGNVYSVSVSSLSVNPDKGLELTLSYDKNTADLGDIAVGRFNETTGKWEQVQGVATVNPLKGTIKVKIKKLSPDALSRRPGAAGAAALAADPLFSHWDGSQYAVHPLAAAGTLDSGTFAVVKQSSLTSGDAFTGAKLKVFNYPNPFNLSSKSVNLLHSASNPTRTTVGTTIRLDLPASNGGAVSLRIYNVAGELVREIDLGTIAGGNYYYVDWDGKNKDGTEVANGVYFGIVNAPGIKAKDATWKMAVIK